jgi:hypothetical protein
MGIHHSNNKIMLVPLYSDSLLSNVNLVSDCTETAGAT